jgi:Protein of unknown function (DUF3891)
VLISRRPDHLQYVTHPDHGRLAGALCSHWGNERFERPSAFEALLTAATHHDDGWVELDGRPEWNAQERRPAHFLELPLSVTVPPYGRGVDSVYARDPHAGALASMHWAGLYSARWGLQASDPVPHRLAGEVVAEQERRWAAALRAAWNYEGPRSRFEADTWHAYELLQALDFVSLALCLLDLEQPTTVDGEAAAMPGTLASVEQPAGARIVPNVPSRPGGPYHDVRLWVGAPERVHLDPYPFDEPAFELTVPTRSLEDRPYGSAEEAATTFHAVAPRVRAFVVASPP